jgi:hypothetical protein
MGRLLAQFAQRRGTEYDTGRFTSARFSGLRKGMVS